MRTLDDRDTTYRPGAVAVEAAKIVAVGPDAELAGSFQAGRTIDARGGLVHPGLIDAHYHATLHLLRATIPDQAPSAVGENARASFAVFSRWINQLDDDDEHASALLAAAEMARNGVTCFMDPGTCFSPAAVAAAVQAVGIRASLGDPFLWDVEGGLALASQIERAPADRGRAFDLLGTELGRNHDPDALVRGHVALYGSGSASEPLIRAAKERADEAGVTMTQHQNLDGADAGFDDRRFGRNALVHLAERGLLGPGSTFMHMNVLREDEIDAVAEAGMSVVWHPGNFFYYAISAAGPSPVPELRRRGVTVAFGTDLAKAWTFGDGPLLGYVAARAQRERFSAKELLAMLTREGARAVGRGDDLGTLTPGKRADIVVRTVEIPEMTPTADPVHSAVLVARSKSVATVVCDGEVVVEDGRLTRVDEDDVGAVADASARRMAERVGF